MHKHRWSLASNLDEKYFGKHGFHSPQALHRKENTLNLNKLAEIIPTGQTTIDLTSMGYTKLLGTGKLTQALTITIPSFSKSAAEKITSAGGKVITETEEETAQTAEAEP
jgi:large subunit ribosomal protein L15